MLNRGDHHFSFLPLFSKSTRDQYLLPVWTDHITRKILKKRLSLDPTFVKVVVQTLKELKINHKIFAI